MLTHTFTLIMLFLGVTASLAQQPEADGPKPYIEWTFHDGAQASTENQVGSSESVLPHAQNKIAFYSKHGAGFAINGGIRAMADCTTPPDYELMYSYVLGGTTEKPILYGRFYSLNFTDSIQVDGGLRRAIRQPIEFGRSYDLHFMIGDKQPLTVQYTVYPDKKARKSSEPIFAANSLTLQTYCQAPGGEQKASHGHPLVLLAPQPNVPNWGREPHVYQTQFTSGTPESANLALEYRVTASFEPQLDGVHYPIRTMLTFAREYALDTNYSDGTPLTPEQTSGVVFTKEIELVKGRLLKLVFPPDSETLKGFVIQDTLVINP